MFVAWAAAVELFGIPLEGRTGDLALGTMCGTAFTAPLAAYHLWITRHLWRHGGVARLARRRGRTPR